MATKLLHYGNGRSGPNSDVIAMLAPMGSSPEMAITAEAERPLRHAANFPSPATHVSLTLMSAIASGLTL
jgi:hypothetical protein